ncbi:hypothetical protein Scep_017685 [Stephania cephalantha]|uniref:Nucleotidyl transferase domain-containing protein n=1 Tax=Stephania cephalantha TaxID=152367 RepID=A0AAP0IQ06_9MAGN
MGSSEERVVAVIMVGGPTKGTRFRPLSLNIPKPLFPLAGQPMVHHPISACKRIPNLVQIYLVGFYEEREFALYVSSISNELRVPVRYLREDKPHGSAGGLYNFRDLIMEDNPVSAESANQFGELVADPDTKELLHYTEKPETFVSIKPELIVILFSVSVLSSSSLRYLSSNRVSQVSDLINCGVYIFTPDIFSAIQNVSVQRKERVYGGLTDDQKISVSSALVGDNGLGKIIPSDFVRLDQDILSPLAGKKQLYTYQTLDFWEQIKTPGMSLKCSELYLAQFQITSPHLLANGDGKKTATIKGDVYIHPSAKIHPTAKIGPNVSISANARIGPGARLISCIILDDVEIKENAVVIHSIVGWKSSIGKWARVQASLSFSCPGFHASQIAEGDYYAKLGITILGESVIVEDEVVVISSIILPNKTLNVSVQDEIIL